MNAESSPSNTFMLDTPARKPTRLWQGTQSTLLPEDVVQEGALGTPPAPTRHLSAPEQTSSPVESWKQTWMGTSRLQVLVNSPQVDVSELLLEASLAILLVSLAPLQVALTWFRHSIHTYPSAQS